MLIQRNRDLKKFYQLLFLLLISKNIFSQDILPVAISIDGIKQVKFKHEISGKDECIINTIKDTISIESAVGIYSIGATKVEKTNDRHKHPFLVSVKIFRFLMRIIYQNQAKTFKSETNLLTTEMKNELANIKNGSILAFEGIVCGFDISEGTNILPLIYFIK